MTRIAFTLFCFIWTSINLHSQAELGTEVQNYFRSPVDYAYKLSGNFGELRETHFHSGIDIKSSHSGQPDKIFSIGDGFVSRIFVAPGGYGRAIYIDHPEVGYTSVYAHLDSFNPAIEAIARQHQIADESFEVDFNLDPSILPVTKGSFIGILGNSGYSFGPHLHFEIRDTKTEQPLNPFLFGMGTKDTTSPTISSIALHGLDPDFYKVCDLRIPILDNESSVINISSPIEVPAWRMGVAIQSYDRMDGINNKNGIYSLHMYVDDSLTFSYHMDKISFEQTKNIIGFFDYEVKKNEQKTFALCYKFPGNTLEFLQNNGPGIFPLFSSRDRNVRLEIQDFDKNKKTIQLVVRRSTNMNEAPAKIPYKQKIIVGEETSLEEANAKVSFENQSLFRDLYFQFSSTNSPTKETLYHVHDPLEPIKRPIPLYIKPSIQNINSDKAIIVKINKNGSKINLGGTWKEGYLMTRIREFGNYTIDYDTISPSIKPTDFNPKASKKSAFQFLIKDNMPVRGDDADDLTYKVWIDGVFVICPMSQKTSLIQIPLQNMDAGTHQLLIEAKDHSGNKTTYSNTFMK